MQTGSALEALGAVDALVTALGVFDRAQWPRKATPEGDGLRRWLLRQSAGTALQDALTIHDAEWVQLTLAMARLDTKGVYFVDCEQPPVLRARSAVSGGPSSRVADLPVVCHRRATGLELRLARHNAAATALERLLRFSHDERGVPTTMRVVVNDAACDGAEILRLLDDLSFGCCFSAPPAWRPDGATHAGLVPLGSGPGARERWVETRWLTHLGFYSLASHVANRIEVALWARLRAASSRAGKSSAGPEAAFAHVRLAQLQASALQNHASDAHAAVAMTLGRMLRLKHQHLRAAGDWQSTRVALEDAVLVIRCLVEIGEGGDDMPQRLVWQPMHVACSRAGAMLAACGDAAVKAIEHAQVQASNQAAAALISEEEIRRQREKAQAADAARKASRRAAQSAAASERGRIRAVAAKMAADTVAAVIARAAAEERAAATVVVNEQQPLRKVRKIPGWVPGLASNSREEQRPHSAGEASAFISMMPVDAPCLDMREPQSVAITSSGPAVSDRHHYSDVFQGGLFWSSADLVFEHRGRHHHDGVLHDGSSVGSDSDSDSSSWMTTSSSAAAIRESWVGKLLIDTPEASPRRLSSSNGRYFSRTRSGGSRSGMSSPRNIPFPGQHNQHVVARSLAGSPVSVMEHAASRPSTASATSSPSRGSRRNRGTSAEPSARPPSPLTLMRVPHPLGRGPQHTPGLPPTPPQPPRVAPQPSVWVTPAQLRHLCAAPACSAGKESTPFREALASRAAFWADAGSEGALRATALGEQLLAYWSSVQAASYAAHPARLAAVHRVTRVLQDLWPRARTHVFGSEACGLSLPTSDIDLIVQLPPVRQLPPIEEAGILEGRNGVTETVLKQAYRWLGNAAHGWVVPDSLRCIENTAVPIITLAVRTGPYDVDSVRLDLSFDGPHHQGLATCELVRSLLSSWPILAPLILCLKAFLAGRSLHHAFTGGLSSYGLTLLLAAFVKHADAMRPSECFPALSSPEASRHPHLLGTLLADVLHFYGGVFDPRKRCVALAPPTDEGVPQGGGAFPAECLFPARVGGLIDVLHIVDPLQGPQGVNAGRNCFRYVQIQRALADASAQLDSQLGSDGAQGMPTLALLVGAL